MEVRLTAHILGVALLIATSLATMASQSGPFVGVHEVPSFVCDRTELVPAAAVERSAKGVESSPREHGAPTGVQLPGSRNPICAREAGK